MILYEFTYPHVVTDLITLCPSPQSLAADELTRDSWFGNISLDDNVCGNKACGLLRRGLTLGLIAGLVLAPRRQCLNKWEGVGRKSGALV